MSWFQRLLDAISAGQPPPGPIVPPHPAPPVPAPPAPDPAQLSPLWVQGRFFADAEGKHWQWRGCDGFDLLAKYLRGEDIMPILKQRADMGFNVLRVFRFAAPPNAFALNPSDYGNEYPVALRLFMELLESYGLRAELTAGDAQIVMPDPREQQRHLDAVCEVLRGQVNLFIETCNEPFKNGIDVGRIKPPATTLRASGNYDDGSLHQHLLDYHTIHGTRDDSSPVFPKWIWDQIWCLYDGWPGFPALNMPVIHDEPMGCADVSQPGRRSNNSHHFYLLGTTANYEIGLTFHCENGMRSELFSDIQGLCASEFIRGVRTAL